MGYYIEFPNPHGKAEQVITKFGEDHVKQVSLARAKEAVDDPNVAVICVMDNIIFEAAGWCFDRNEFNAFSDPDDPRGKEYLVITPRKLIEDHFNFTRTAKP